MKKNSYSIVFKYVLAVSLSLLAVCVTGIWSGSTLLSNMGALNADKQLLQALQVGRSTILVYRDQRKILLERIVANCVAAGKWPHCEFFGLPSTVAILGDNTSQGWHDEKNYILEVNGSTYRITLDWNELKPQYQILSDVIHIREHLNEVFPRVRYSFILVFILAIASVGCLGVLSIYLLSRRLGRRVRELSRYAYQIAAGELIPAPPATRGSDEIGLLASSMEKMAKDLSETREKLIFTQKMQSWQAVARKIAHEIKNPLTPITIVAEQLQRSKKHASPELQETLAEASRILYEEAGALGHMAKEFTAFARLPEPRLDHIDALALVQDFIQRNQRSGGPLFKLNSSGLASCSVMGDRGMLMQIFHNLVNNAALAKAPERVTVIFTLSLTKSHCLIDVSDDGPGVPEALCLTLFDAYVSSRSTGEVEKGMGLGLTISRKIATDHRGTLKLLHSGPGGASFRCELPRAVFADESQSLNPHHDQPRRLKRAQRIPLQS